MAIFTSSTTNLTKEDLAPLLLSHVLAKHEAPSVIVWRRGKALLPPSGARSAPRPTAAQSLSYLPTHSKTSGQTERGHRINPHLLPRPGYKPACGPILPKKAKFDCSNLPHTSFRILPFLATKGFLRKLIDYRQAAQRTQGQSQGLAQLRQAPN